jgi:hypothetical protein
VQSPRGASIELQGLAHLSWETPLVRSTCAELDEPLSVRFELDVLTQRRRRVDTQTFLRDALEATDDGHGNLLVSYHVIITCARRSDAEATSTTAFAA